jgi:hypothetical protein
MKIAIKQNVFYLNKQLMIKISNKKVKLKNNLFIRTNKEIIYWMTKNKMMISCYWFRINLIAKTFINTAKCYYPLLIQIHQIKNVIKTLI